MEVRYENLKYSVKLATTAANSQIPTVGSTLMSVARAPVRIMAGLLSVLKSKKEASPLNSSHPGLSDFKVLENVSGVLRPGTLTLLIAPPGHGKSAFMKALTGLLPHKALSGKITYSGMSAEDAKKNGIHIGSLAQYVQQV